MLLALAGTSPPLLVALTHADAAARPTQALADSGCAWWNLACKGGEQIANSGLSAITKSIASGAEDLLSQIVKIIDESSTVPLADPVYRHVYFGFLGLAATLIAVVLLMALIVASLKRDLATLGRAAVGVGIAAVGGALYIVLAQLLVAVDDWLSHGIVEVTGYNLAQSIDQIAAGFRNIAGTPGDIAANMLLILLMLTMLVSGLILWFVLVLRKIAILVVVAFAPLLIAGYGWAPTRAWVQRTTEVLVALVFTKTAIYALFGIGLALLSRGSGQSFSDFVGTTVLMCGACFTPFVMLKLVGFAAQTHLAHDALSTLHSGMQPVTRRLGGLAPAGAMGRSDLARAQASGPTADGPRPSVAGNWNGGAGSASSAGGAGQPGAAGAGPLVAAAAVTAAAHGAAKVGDVAQQSATNMTQGSAGSDKRVPGPSAAPSPNPHEPGGA